MSADFTCDLNGANSALPHVWEHTVGSSHARMALRSDWQELLHPKPHCPEMDNGHLFCER
jgi:hypothetical protein